MLLGEVRDVTFSSRDLALYAQVLLEELQIGPLQSGMRAIVPPQDYFERSPSLTVVNGTDRYMEIYLREETDDYLLLNGGTRAQLLGSICYTLTSFIPELEGIVAYIGGETVTSLTLADGSTWSSPTGRLTRETFASFAADMCTVYFPLADGTACAPYSGPLPRTSAPSRARSCASSWIPRAIPRSPLRFPRASATRISWGCKSPRTRRWSTSPTPLPPHAQA